MNNRLAWLALVTSTLWISRGLAEDVASPPLCSAVTADSPSDPSRESCHEVPCCSCCCCLPAWTIRADAIWLARSAGNDVYLGQTFAVAGGETADALFSDDADFPMRAGMRFQVAYHVDRKTTWEAIYFGLHCWSGGRTLLPNLEAGTLAESPWTQTDKLIGGFDTGLGFQTASRLNSVEVNRRYQRAEGCCWSAATLVGLRYLQWDESFRLIGANEVPPAIEEIDAHTHNHLVGSQIGGELRRDWERLHLGLEGKAGLFANIFEQRRSNLNSTGVQPGGFPEIVPVDDSERDAGVAGVLDFSATLSYQLTRHLSARGGYQLLYVAGLALAPNQLGGFSHGRDVFLHGPTAGLEMAW